MKLVEEETATVTDLCTKARRHLIFLDLHAENDVRDSFNEVSSQDKLTTKLVGAISKLTENQAVMENKLEALTRELLQVNTSTPQPQRPNNRNWNTQYDEPNGRYGNQYYQ